MTDPLSSFLIFVPQLQFNLT